MRKSFRSPFMPWHSHYSRSAKSVPRAFSSSKEAPTEFHPFSIAQACMNVLESLRQRTRKNKPNILLDVDPSIPPLVKGDEAQLENLLHLLLSGILELGSGKPVIFSVVTRRFTPDGMEALFSIDWAHQQETPVFIPVMEGSATPGLGFSICSAVITSMGGRMNVKKEGEKGFFISFYLPFSTDNLPEEGVGPTPADILLVEDNSMNRKVLAACLEHGGYAVHAVSSGQEALDVLFEREWSAILMDIQMPDMDGVRTTAAVRAAEDREGRRTPVIAVTAYAGEEDRERCLRAGMDAYLAKPVKLETLLLAVAEVTNSIPSLQKADEEELDARASILAFTEGDEELATKIVKEFLELAHPLLDSIRIAFEEKDRPRLRLFLHRIKGNLAYFGEGTAFQIAQRLHEEIAALSEEEIASLLLSLITETQELGEELRTLWQIFD